MASSQNITGSQALLQTLEAEGVDVVFGIPGGAILPAYDPLLDSPIRHVLARHEQGAGHMAEGYAHASGRVGVVIATSGPGATNLVTPLQDALMDSVPLVAITGQVATTTVGSDAFQEAFTSGLATHCTKHAYLLTDAGRIIDTVHEAFHIAGSGRPGPVLIDIPKDVLNAATTWHEPGPVDLPGYRPTTRGHQLQVRRAVEVIEASQRPVLYVGGGVVNANADAELFAFAEATNVPVVTTLMARGAFPDTHPLALGMSGMHGTYTATTAMQRADLLVSLGARFDDRVTGDPKTFAPDAKVVHVDIDPAEIGKVRVADVPVVGDARVVLTQLLAELERRRGGSGPPDRTQWLQTVAGWQQDYPLGYHQSPDGPIKAQFFVEQLHEATGGDAIVVSGVGQHQMWASQFWQFTKPRAWINSGGLGTMGFAIPAAIGAKVARPQETVYALDGDGCFQMTCQELICAAAENVPIKVAVLNNSSLGMVRQWQDLFYEGRHSATIFNGAVPDFARMAEAMGCAGLKVEHPNDVRPAIEKSLSVDDKPVVLEVKIDPDEMCFPMVAAGGCNDDVALGPEDLT